MEEIKVYPQFCEHCYVTKKCAEIRLVNEPVYLCSECLEKALNKLKEKE